MQVWIEAEAWLRSLHLVREDYHGKFEGNECQTILKNSSKLRTLIEKECQSDNRFV